MRPVNPRQPSRLTLVIVPVVVVIAVVILVIALNIAAAVAQGIDETSSTLVSNPDDPFVGANEVEGAAPSINKVIVVSDLESVEAASVETDATQVGVEDPVAALPATGLRASVSFSAVAMVAAGAVALVLRNRGVS